MGCMAKKIPGDSGRAALRSYVSALPEPSDQGSTPAPDWQASHRDTIATAVRWTLQVLAEQAPGRAVEVRVPPYGAVQVMAGTTHRRGTPPAVVEMSAETWLALVVGRLGWAEALGARKIDASGERADLSALLPLVDSVTGAILVTSAK